MSDFLPKLDVSDFTYTLPEERIASFPTSDRTSSKLLLCANNTLNSHAFSALPNLLNPNSFLIFNDTKVIPARLLFQFQKHEIEIFLLKPLSSDWSIWEVMVGNRRRFESATALLSQEYTKNGLMGRLQVNWSNRDSNIISLTAIGSLDIPTLIELHGNIPLPPYIKRKPVESDKERYQTVFSKNVGAVAAPTASLHFTRELINELAENGVGFAHLTLHVGLGTFKPITAEFTSDHAMHSEEFELTSEFIKTLIVNRSKLPIAVGTTSMRLLESLYYIGAGILIGKEQPEIIHKDVGFDPKFHGIDVDGALQALLQYIEEKGGMLKGETSIFILPGFEFKITKGLITNFHQPGSTLLMLVAAFIGKGWKEIYEYALQNNFRFLSYGDSSLLFPTLK